MKTTYDVTVTPRAIREAWATIQSGGMPFGGRQKASGTVRRFADYRSANYNEFVGASGPEIQDRLENGYQLEGKDLKVSGNDEFALPQIVLDDEEGNLLVDQVLSGEDFYRATWADAPAQRNLTIRACIGMHAGVDAKVLGAYMSWVLKLVDAAQRDGIQPAVQLWIGTKGSTFSGQGEGESMTVRIPLCEAGEMIDPTAWQAYLAPGAFRSLGFVAMALGADQTTRYLSDGMGQPTNREWAISFEDDVLDIECPGGTDFFPEEMLDAMLEAAYAA